MKEDKLSDLSMQLSVDMKKDGGRMEQSNQTQKANNQTSIPWIVLGVFSLVLVLISFFIFLVNYDAAYFKDPYGIAGVGMVIISFVLSACSLFVATILKIGLKERVRFWTLALASALLPILCLAFNHWAYKPGGALSALVDDGGPFHFIVEGDYNFDGINDETYHYLYEERTYSQRYGGHFDDRIIDIIDVQATGIGGGLSGTFCSYDWEDQVIDFHMDRDVAYTRIKIEVVFHEAALADNATFTVGKKEIFGTRTGERTVEFVLDSDACSEIQKDAEDKYIEISVKYTISD